MSVLMDEIIELLSSDQGRLTDALLKTQVLLYKIGRKDLAEWVSMELNGYPNDEDVPSYRVLGASVLGNVSNGSWRYSEYRLPISHMKPATVESWTKVRLNESVSVLEKFGPDGSIVRKLPPEVYGYLAKPLSGGYHIEAAWCETPAHDVAGVLTKIRTKLLEFVLELKDALGDADDSALPSKAAVIDAGGMFRNAIFGDNAIVVMGSHNALGVQNSVQKGDFSSLAQVLEVAKIPANEIKSLLLALTADHAEGGVSISEGRTGQWFLGLLSKAGKGSFDVAKDVVAKLVIEAVTRYAGL